jgi:hypothetical protein
MAMYDIQMTVDWKPMIINKLQATDLVGAGGVKDHDNIPRTTTNYVQNSLVGHNYMLVFI